MLRAKIKIKNFRIRAGIGPKPTISLGKWQSGPSPGTPPGPKPYEVIGFGNIHGPKPYEFIGFGDSYDPKPYKFIGFGGGQYWSSLQDPAGSPVPAVAPLQELWATADDLRNEAAMLRPRLCLGPK